MRSPLLISVSLLIMCAFLVVACGEQPAQTIPAQSSSNLSGIKTYLEQKIGTLKIETTLLKTASNNYYTLAKNANFNYSSLLKTQSNEVIETLNTARTAWKTASPSYEQMEGIVAGVSLLSKYDVILDAGVSAKEGGEDVVPFDLKLPDGRTLTKPGNLFGITESTLWGTAPEYSVPNLVLDFNKNGKTDFGDALPDANVLKSAADALDQYTAELSTTAKQWQPTESEAFTALTANVPTVSDFFDSWKNSRFVAGENGNLREFAVISRLSDIMDNITSWQTIYKGLSPRARTVDADLDAQITKELNDLYTYAANLEKQEQNGKRFTAEEANLLSNEAQSRADAINGRITQMAAKLNVRIQQQ